MRTVKPISVTPGPLDREEPILDDVMREKVQASMTDDRPDVPAGDVFKRLRAHHGRRMKADKSDA